MRRIRAWTPLVVAAVLAAGAGSAAAHSSRPASGAGVPGRIVFPVVGAVEFSDDFGSPRAQGGHPGNDILAARRAPVVAAEAGTIRLWTTSATAGCMLYLYGRSGTVYLYIHLNNDLGPGNDNRGSCVDGVAYATGLEDGQSVERGELVGYVGDSGDANGRHPHLHFEIHPAGGPAVSPFAWLKRAQHLSAPLGAAPPVPSGF